MALNIALVLKTLICYNQSLNTCIQTYGYAALFYIGLGFVNFIKKLTEYNNP